MKALLILILLVFSCKTYQIDGNIFETEEEMNEYIQKQNRAKKLKSTISENQKRREKLIDEVIGNKLSKNNILFLQECIPLRLISTSFCASEYNYFDESQNRYVGLSSPYVGNGDPALIEKTENIRNFIKSHFNSLEFPRVSNNTKIKLNDYNKELFEEIRKKEYIILESNYFDSSNLSDYDLKNNSFTFYYHANDNRNLFQEKILTEYFFNIPNLKLNMKLELAENFSKKNINYANLYFVLLAKIKIKNNQTEKILEFLPMRWIVFNEETMVSTEILNK